MVLIISIVLLLDWLIDRRHCDVRWHHQLRQIREKVSQSLSGLPKGTPAELLELKDEESMSHSRLFGKELA